MCANPAMCTMVWASVQVHQIRTQQIALLQCTMLYSPNIFSYFPIITPWSGAKNLESICWMKSRVINIKWGALLFLTFLLGWITDHELWGESFSDNILMWTCFMNYIFMILKGPELQLEDSISSLMKRLTVYPSKWIQFFLNHQIIKEKDNFYIDLLVKPHTETHSSEQTVGNKQPNQ